TIQIWVQPHDVEAIFRRVAQPSFTDQQVRNCNEFVTHIQQRNTLAQPGRNTGFLQNFLQGPRRSTGRLDQLATATKTHTYILEPVARKTAVAARAQCEHSKWRRQYERVAG